LELDLQVRLGGGAELLAEGERGPLGIFVVRDLGRFERILRLAIFCGESGAVDDQLVGVEHDLLRALQDLELDIDCSLVEPIAEELQVIQRQVVIGRLDTAGVSIIANGGCLTCQAGCLDRRPC